MIQIKQYFFSLLIFMFIFSGCTKQEYDNKPITSEWLLPLFKLDLKPLSLSTLNNKAFSISITGSDLGYDPNTLESNPNPSFYTNIASYEMETNNLIYGIKLNICLIDVTITNNFPIALKAGTQISVKNLSDSTTILTFNLTKDILNGTSLTQEIDLSNQYISDKLYFSVDTFKLDSFQNEKFDKTVQFDFFFKKVSLFAVEVSTNQNYTLSDTIEFDGNSIDFTDTDNKINDSTLNATITIKSLNELPINISFQIYFIDKSLTVLDSMFVPSPNIFGAEYNGSNFVNGTKSEFKTTISKKRIERIRNATNIVGTLKLNSNGYSGTSVIITDEMLLAMKLIGDIKIILDPLSF